MTIGITSKEGLGHMRKPNHQGDEVHEDTPRSKTFVILSALGGSRFVRVQAQAHSAQRHSRLSAKIHSHKFPTQKFRERRRRDHGRIVRRKRPRRKEHRKPLHPRLALKRGPQFPISRNPATYKKSSNVILARRSQRLRNQIVNHGPLERRHQIESLPVAESPNVRECSLLYIRKRLPPSLNRSLHTLRLDVAQNRRLNSAVGEIKVRPIIFRKLPMIP